ncbi:hypothetical protein D1818_10875 [Aquimarina sp. BL5]|uniref:hypothetical protein n=1 Tax=Aquimarina sp. BL5 TaxID=1714860 RepID=UPI000E46C295|nr:hypothetical protein [Aquimarina sp. BL5]AXT51308.1 hypothetical protein D1818_10875 [Aquimarina sp. BL5]RKM91385.1 hypothetical protein D7036_23305 [Aquimarina sp. BL5]
MKTKFLELHEFTILSREQLKYIVGNGGGTASGGGGGTVTCAGITASYVVSSHNNCWHGSDNGNYNYCMNCAYAWKCGVGQCV